MYQDVAIGTKGIGWRVLPCLESTSIQQVVSLRRYTIGIGTCEAPLPELAAAAAKACDKLLANLALGIPLSISEVLCNNGAPVPGAPPPPPTSTPMYTHVHRFVPNLQACMKSTDIIKLKVCLQAVVKWWLVSIVRNVQSYKSTVAFESWTALLSESNGEKFLQCLSPKKPSATIAPLPTYIGCVYYCVWWSKHESAVNHRGRR